MSDLVAEARLLQDKILAEDGDDEVQHALEDELHLLMLTVLHEGRCTLEEARQAAAIAMEVDERVERLREIVMDAISLADSDLPDEQVGAVLAAICDELGITREVVESVGNCGSEACRECPPPAAHDALDIILKAAGR